MTRLGSRASHRPSAMCARALAGLLAANGTTEADRIAFGSGAAGTVELGSMLPSIVHTLEIVGPGPETLTVRRNPAAGPFRIFEVANDVAASISGMTISGGKAENGAGISAFGPLTLTRVVLSGNEATSASNARGAAISIPGTPSTGLLTLRESLITGNVAKVTGSAGASVVGGAVRAEGGGLIERSTIGGNTVEISSATGAVQVLGAGVELAGTASEIRQSTITGNSIVVNQGAQNPELEGAGVFGDPTSHLIVTGSTIAANSIDASQPGQGANVFNAEFRDSIVAAGLGATSCAGRVTSFGFNLEDGTSCRFIQPGDLSNTDPLLSPTLADNGGPTPARPRPSSSRGPAASPPSAWRSSASPPASRARASNASSTGAASSPARAPSSAS